MTRIAIKEHVFSMMSDDVVFEVLTLVIRVSLIGTLFARAHIWHEIRLGRVRNHEGILARRLDTVRARL